MRSFKEYITEVENWDSQMFGNKQGNLFSVKHLHDYASQVSNGPVMLPIKHTDGIEYWHKTYSLENPDHVERMQNADTSFPVLAIETGKNQYTVPDGLNRIMKAHSVEGKTHVPAMVLTSQQFDDFKLNNIARSSG